MSYCLLQEAGSQETSSVGDWNTENIDGLIEVDSVSSLDSTTRTVTEQFLSRHSETPRTLLDKENHTAGTDLRHGFYSGTPLSVNTSLQVVENRSRCWSSTAEVSSTASNCSSRASQVTVPATSPCTSESPRSAETFDESRENRFRQNQDSATTSPTIAFRQSFKIRLLERAGINPTWNSEEHRNAATSSHPAWVGSDVLEPKGKILRESKTTRDCGRDRQSPLDLIGSQSTCNHHQNADRSPPTEDLCLPGSPSTRAESSMKFPTRVCVSSSSDDVCRKNRAWTSDSIQSYSHTGSTSNVENSPQTGEHHWSPSTRAESSGAKFSLRQGDDVLLESRATSDCGRSPPAEHQDLIGSPATASEHPGGDRSPQTGHAVESSRTFPFLLSALMSPSSVTRAVYPSVYQPRLSYDEAAAIFYNQLAAVHQLQQSGTGPQPRL